MGGDVHAPIGTEVKVGEKYLLGGEYYGYLIASPVTGETYVVESETGAIVGSSIMMAREDIDIASPEVMTEQIADAKEKMKKVDVLSPEKFWEMMSRARGPDES